MVGITGEEISGVLTTADGTIHGMTHFSTMDGMIHGGAGETLMPGMDGTDGMDGMAGMTLSIVLLVSMETDGDGEACITDQLS